jgi:hypothetical protein
LETLRLQPGVPRDAGQHPRPDVLGVVDANTTSGQPERSNTRRDPVVRFTVDPMRKSTGVRGARLSTTTG